MGEADIGLERKRTYDHVIPRAHKGRHVTIPACRPCNATKGKTGLPEFMTSEYFSSIRKKRKPNQWSLRDLWLVMALAAVEQARSNAQAWPVDARDSD
ncbi:HNH endonuclease [Mesorhizobium marinum]|uniref:HNH endonuclease n=1 Tax=Mesorhizobium marinum TaxID=3228790 RepID=A0ABV3R475_9HYPH